MDWLKRFYSNPEPKPMELIRIEHPADGKGVWRSKGFTNGLNQEELDPIAHTFTFFEEMQDSHSIFPTPWEDLRGFTSRYFCGFKTIEQMRIWIKPEWFDEIIEKGFKIYRINASNCMEGKNQIVYTKDSVTSKEDITDLFKVKLVQ